MLCRAIKSFENAFEPSIWAVSIEGAKHGIFAERKSFSIPLTIGTSGPHVVGSCHVQQRSRGLMDIGLHSDRIIRVTYQAQPD